MLNKRVFAAAVLSVSLVVPSVAQAEPAVSRAELNAANDDDGVNAEQVGLFNVELKVNPIKAGDKKIFGTVTMAKEQTEQTINVVFMNAQTASTTVFKTQFASPEIVDFEILVQDAVTLGTGETVRLAPVPSQNNPAEGKKFIGTAVTVQPAVAVESEKPSPAPTPIPEPETPKPDQPEPPQGGQQTPNPDAGEQTPGDKEQQKPESPEDPKTPENEGQKPGEEKKPEAPNAPEDKDKQPEPPKNPGKEPKDPQVPGGDGKKPEVDKDALQGSSTIGDFFKTLAALGGVAGIVSGIVNLFSQGSSGANFVQPLRDFLAQFNSKF
ncbi:hypothetical protein NLL32_08390 [Corynebacterium propinquum]|uniref:hypothetical protein n=1 Tax=Corynebacterium propinquum TaxID=43769 RepID=UPI000665118B|nr:hypothetical protein [Corynebacterium propinquum]WKS48748.1 hypothetical protein NLL32_08390 [Corynebacterium propinquum]